MTNFKKHCAFCGNELVVTHGNRRYHENCAYEAKKQRSNNQYIKLNQQLDPYWRNEKILRELYYTYGEESEIDPTILTQMAFDFKLYKTRKHSNGLDQFFMNQHGFSIKQNRKIVLCKI